jgi:formylglycine-generating enzyme required for sulfatase activity
MTRCIQLSIVAFAVLFAGAADAADNVAEIKTLKAKSWIVPGVDMRMKLIPAGKFTMGSSGNEAGRLDDEVQHEVTISKPFYMGVYEVTQGQFYPIMMPDYDYDTWEFSRGAVEDGTAFHFRERPRGLMGTDNAFGNPIQTKNPMECVSWARAVEFCKKITDRERKARRLPAGYVYRLPTEAEWEYACRAGTSTPLNVELKSYTAAAEVKKVAQLDKVGDRASFTANVGKLLPNAWGLYDMHGNVYEWCLDWYGPYPKGKVTNPTGPAKGVEKVMRGGCFGSMDFWKIVNLDKAKASSQETETGELGSVRFLRSAHRASTTPDTDYYGILGFRVVLAPQLEN